MRCESRSIEPRWAYEKKIEEKKVKGRKKIKEREKNLGVMIHWGRVSLNFSKSLRTLNLISLYDFVAKIKREKKENEEKTEKQAK